MNLKRGKILRLQPKIVCTFLSEDVQTVFEISNEEAKDWLSKNGKYVQESMTEAGYNAIRTLGLEDGLKLVREYNES